MCGKHLNRAINKNWSPTPAIHDRCWAVGFAATRPVERKQLSNGQLLSKWLRYMRLFTITSRMLAAGAGRNGICLVRSNVKLAEKNCYAGVVTKLQIE